MPTAIIALGALRSLPLLPGLSAQRPMPRGWPAWLPAPANRPDASTFGAGAFDDEAASAPLPATAIGGWYSSSLDLKLGLEVRDLGPVECLDEWERALA
jgi:hypothetical protein